MFKTSKSPKQIPGEFHRPSLRRKTGRPHRWHSPVSDEWHPPCPVQRTAHRLAAAFWMLPHAMFIYVYIIVYHSIYTVSIVDLD